MPFVSRDRGGNINGVFTAEQKGRAEEFLADDDQELIDFRTPKVDAPGDKVEREIAGSRFNAALVKRTAAKENISERQLIDELRSFE